MREQDEIREFLTTRRSRLTPEQVGLPDFGGRRRVAGLRREEVALLAGISVQYYVRFERGTATGISDSVLDGVSRALRLDDVECQHLCDLVRAVNTAVRPTRPPSQRSPILVSAALQQTLDAMTEAPAVVQNGRLDILATNRLGRALFSELLDSPQSPANFACFLFLDDRATGFYRDWDEAARMTVAMLRAEAGRSPRDRALDELVGELSVRNDRFRTLWATHDVREHRSGVKRVHHSVVGDLDLDYTALNISTDPGLQLLAYTARSGTPSEEGLRLLGSWTADSKKVSRARPRRTHSPATRVPDGS